MHDYVYGAGIALEEIAKRFVEVPDSKKDGSSRSVNLLGVTPLDFGPQENVELLKANLEQYGWKVVSTWAMGDELETLQRSAEADVNLVVSAVGLRAAKVLREKFGMPYVIGTPNQWDGRRNLKCTGQGSCQTSQSSRRYICRTACSRMQTLH